MHPKAKIFLVKKKKKKKKKIDNLFTVKNMGTIVQQQVTEVYSIRFVKQFLIELSVIKK